MSHVVLLQHYFSWPISFFLFCEVINCLPPQLLMCKDSMYTLKIQFQLFPIQTQEVFHEFVLFENYFLSLCCENIWQYFTLGIQVSFWDFTLSVSQGSLYSPPWWICCYLEFWFSSVLVSYFGKSYASLVFRERVIWVVCETYLYFVHSINSFDSV